MKFVVDVEKTAAKTETIAVFPEKVCARLQKFVDKLAVCQEKAGAELKMQWFGPIKIRAESEKVAGFGPLKISDEPTA